MEGSPTELIRDGGRKLFGDHYPKEIPDTVYDYLPQIEWHEKYHVIPENIPLTGLRGLRKGGLRTRGH